MTAEPTKRPHLRSRAAESADSQPRGPSHAPAFTGSEPKPLYWDDADGLHIDVRGLPPPQPLVAILRLVQDRRARAGAAVIVHHDRDPLLLYAQLDELGWHAERLDGPPGEVRLRLAPGAGG